MPTLFSWSIKPHDSVFLAHGVVSRHPRLLEGAHIHTSSICRITQTEDCLLLETVSGSVYPLLLEELDPFAGGQELSLPSPMELGLSPDFWERCIKAHEQAEEKEKQALRALGIPRVLRLRFVGASVLSALWCGQDGAAHTIPIHMHLGMFQDSVLITNMFDNESGPCRVDFRYFPRRDWVEPYKICHEIDTILIVNEGADYISFGGGEDRILCPPGETTPIAVKNGHVEGRGSI